MKLNISYHDAEINSIQKVDHTLFLGGILANNTPFLIRFDNVIGWDLEPFEEQNVIFDIRNYAVSQIPKWIKEDFEIPVQYFDCLNSGRYQFYFIESSVGLCGYIIASDLIQESTTGETTNAEL